MTRTMPYDVPRPGVGAITTAEVRDVLTEAINVINDRGWIRCSGFTEYPSLTNHDASYDPDDHNTWPVSIRGAINVCAGARSTSSTSVVSPIRTSTSVSL